MDPHKPNAEEKTVQKQPDPKQAEQRPEKGEPHHGELPEGNGNTGKPAAFPPHN